MPCCARAAHTALLVEIAAISVAAIGIHALLVCSRANAYSQTAIEANPIDVTATELRMPAILGDHAILQADRPVPIWGWAQPGTHIEVEFQGSRGEQSKSTDTANKQGHWLGHLSPRTPARLSPYSEAASRPQV